MKEHDLIELTAPYEYISSPIEEDRDTFDTLVAGARGTVVYVAPDEGGCYVEFPQILEKYPDADPVTWVTFDEMKKAD